jgi:hypothetical protein
MNRRRSMKMNQIIRYLSKLQKTRIFLLSLFLLFIIGLIDYSTGVELSFSIFYLLPVIICAWFVDRRSGLILSLAGTFIWYLSDLLTSPSYSHPVIPYWNAFVMLGTFTIISEIFYALKLSIDRENQLAIKVQTGLLPKEIPAFNSLQISVTWKPLSHVSGDYYDLVRLGDNKLGICIADVSGHGVAAALLMSNIQAGFRMTLQNDIHPQEVCRQLNHTIKQHQLNDKFVSFFYGIIDTEEKSLLYSNAGHPPPFVVRQDGSADQLSKGGTLLGIVREYCCECGKVMLNDGDVITLFTDGLSEAKNLNSDQFGEEKIMDICKSNIELDSHEIKNNIINAVNEFNNHLHDDDITLLIVKYEEKD